MIKRNVAALVAVAVTLVPGPATGSHTHKHTRHSSVSAQEAREASFKKAQMRRKLRSLATHMHSVQVKIRHAKRQESYIRQNMNGVESRIDVARSSLNRVNDRLTALDARHDAVVDRMDKTMARLAERRRLLGQRIAANYEREQATYASVLIRSRSVHELLSRGFYVRNIVQSDADLIKSIRQDLHQIKVDKHELEAQESEQHELAMEYEARKNDLASQLEQKRAILQDVKQTRQQAEEELDEMESDSEAMTSRIQEWTAMLRRHQEELRAVQNIPSIRGRRHHLTIAEGGNLEWRGGFRRPCDGRRTSGFGMRFHPILHRFRMHTGVDFGAPYGAPIYAAAAGTVMQASYNHGYGNCVVIYHGERDGVAITTLYGHASELLVHEQEQVVAGQIIARVGASGLATGPHLHFEVRHNGVPVEPPF